MNATMKKRLCVSASVASLMFAGSGVAAAEEAAKAAAQTETTFYTRPAIFTRRPSETASMTPVDRFGPVGIGIELHQPAFVMKIKNVEDGSPAAATGQLKRGQIIETINGEALQDIDPRIQLGNIITHAEATDGIVRLRVKDDADSAAREVVVRIPVLGSYSETWPLNCPKSGRIVRNLADLFGRGGYGGAPISSGLRMLFMLSTGEEQDLEVVRGWIQRIVADHEGREVSGNNNWNLGYHSLPLAEYYLRTGDASILPVIQSAVRAAEANYMPGGWSTRGTGTWTYYGGGRMNPAGVHVMTFLLLARECGVEVDETILQDGLRQYFRFAGRGLLAYGDHRPETSYTDNGRNGALAFTMAAAAAQLPAQEDSVYAQARDVSAIRGFYSTHRMLQGHSGGGLGEIWRGAAMGLMAQESNVKYREFMDNRVWFYELSRRFNGSFGIVGGERYDDTNWGAGLGLAYTVPRRTLRITGAPPSKFSHEVALPERPWGTRADDDFLALGPAVDANGKAPAGETMADVSAATIYNRAPEAARAGADALRVLMHHQDMEMRIMAARQAARHPTMVTELLQSQDARVRRAAVDAVLQHRSLRSDANRSILLAMVNDPEESWYVVDGALQALANEDLAILTPHLDRLIYWTEHPEWWLSSTALRMLLQIAASGESVERITTVVGPVMAANQRFSRWTPWNLEGVLQGAEPDAQAALVDMLAGVYTDWPAKSTVHRDPQHPQAGSWFINGLAQLMAALPGGLDRLFTISQQRFPGQTLPHRDVFMGSKQIDENPAMQAALVPLIRDELIPQFVATNRTALEKGERLDELAGLYRRIGVHDYNWQEHGPKRTEMEWYYHSFDPVEQPPLGQERARLGRYRHVTYPKGMENWYQPDFDAKASGWKRGKSPFASVDGELRAVGGCRNGFCGCGEPPNTLWEKEVLLLNGTFEIPPFEEGSRYRILIGGMSHVGSGDGSRIYIDGKLIYERKTAVDRRQGGRPIGTGIGRQWWPAFEDGKVNLAATSFLKYHPRGGRYQNYFTVFIQRMKIPPIGGDMLRLAATVTPMLSAEWQEVQEPDTNVHPDEGTFTWDGKVVANPEIMGAWQVVDQVDRIESFVPGQQQTRNLKPPFSRITFEKDGETDDPLRIWSGTVLMDLDRLQALQITSATLAGKQYLFIEAGGFDTRKGTDWKSPLLVLEAEKERNP